MDYRRAHLLKGLVEEYIATGRPVGSERLLSVLGITVSSATIRNMLRSLEEEGYVTQPHTSAGRIPTDAGYRYYVDCLTFKDPTEERVHALEVKYQEYQEEYERPAQAAAKFLSDLTNALAIGGWLGSKDIHGAGISQIFQAMEDNDRYVAQEVSDLLDNIELYVHNLTHDESGDARVYIGKENPAFASEHTSIIVRTVRLPMGERAILLIAGPKRMPYRKNVDVINAVASLLEHY